ncbi:MAG: helix-turn-helix domain-containing protein [Terriglobales bacterium]
MSQANAARMRGVSRQAVGKLIKAGRLRSIVVGGHTLVSREDVLRYEPKRAGRPKHAG